MFKELFGRAIAHIRFLSLFFQCQKNVTSLLREGSIRVIKALKSDKLRHSGVIKVILGSHFFEL